MRIARVFPTRTTFTPEDDLVFIGEPPIYPVDADVAHVSVTFTWDIPESRRIARLWEGVLPTKLGGPALDGESDKPFVAGMYLKHGVTITSRGCVNNCPHCSVRRGLIEFDEFPEGNIIQDNNFLACSKRHRELVYEMLKKQSGICFKGGLQAGLITPEIADELRSLRVRELWMACDYDGAIEPLRKAVEILLAHGFHKSNLYSYVLIGKEEQRLRAVREMGVMPFAQLYRERTEEETPYTPEMKKYCRLMQRPAITRKIFTQKGISNDQ